jgi:hypothetical protein
MEMKTGALAVLVIGLMVPATLDAQGNGNRGRRPNDVCRVWYDRLPANRQPAPMNCRQAENIARRDRSARVIYGSDSSRSRRGDVFGQYPYPERFPGNRGGWNGGPAYSQGYKDGYDKGLEDADDNDRYNPQRHGRYRSADHEYEDEYGSKEQYRITYREGFLAGYDAGYRDLRSPRR